MDELRQETFRILAIHSRDEYVDVPAISLTSPERPTSHTLVQAWRVAHLAYVVLDEFDDALTLAPRYARLEVLHVLEAQLLIAREEVFVAPQVIQRAQALEEEHGGRLGTHSPHLREHILAHIAARRGQLVGLPQPPRLEDLHNLALDLGAYRGHVLDVVLALDFVAEGLDERDGSLVGYGAALIFVVGVALQQTREGLRYV